MRLEPLAPEHLPGMPAITADAEAVRFTRIPEPLPDGFPADWLARYERGRGARLGRGRFTRERR